MDLNRLKVFVAIIENGSFTAAARALHQPKSRVSRALSLLERDLGVPLLSRTTRSQELTEAGRELYRTGKLALQQIEGSIRDLKKDTDALRGPICITAPEDLAVVFFAEICNAFSRLYPEIQFDLRVENEYVDLFREKVDIAVRVGPSEDGRLIQKKVDDIQLNWVASPSFLSRVDLPANLRSVPTSWLLLFRSAEYWPSWNPDLKLFQQKKVHPPFICNNFFLLKELSLKGRGIALLPDFMSRDELREGSLVKLFKPFDEDALFLVTPHGKNGPKRVRVFFDFLSAELKSRL